MKKEKAIRLHRRAERGLIACETRTAVELKSFVSSRGLDGGNTTLTWKAQLISFLQRADEATTFHHFTDLPPELRIRVYSFDFRSFEPVAPEPPALLAISRLVWEEACPIFYEQVRFVIRAEDLLGGLQTDQPTTNLFEKLDIDTLGRINKLGARWVAFGGPFIPAWDIDLLQHDDASML